MFIRDDCLVIDKLGKAGKLSGIRDVLYNYSMWKSTTTHQTTFTFSTMNFQLELEHALEVGDVPAFFSGIMEIPYSDVVCFEIVDNVTDSSKQKTWKRLVASIWVCVYLLTF